MIQVAIAAFLVWCLFNFIDNEGYVDGFTSLAFILVPAIIMFFVSVGVATFELPQWVAYIFELTYFLVPLLMLKCMTEFTWPKIIGFSTTVFAVNIITQATFYLVLVAPSV